MKQIVEGSVYDHKLVYFYFSNKWTNNYINMLEFGNLGEGLTKQLALNLSNDFFFFFFGS